jgi:NADH dehydrogenase
MSGRHRVVIVGGGFAGLYAAQKLRYAPVEITLVDRRNFHLFQPLLYQVAAGGLSPANIAAPLRAVLARQPNVTTLLGEVIDFDVARREVILRDGMHLGYDSLVVAAGACHHYFRHPEWEPYAPGLKTVEDATAMRRNILLAFERAEKHPERIDTEGLLTFVVVGAGPTGVELAGAVSELACHTLRRNFRRIDPGRAQVLLLEAGDRVLATFPPALSAKALRSLERLRVNVLLKTAVTHIGPGFVEVLQQGQPRRIATGAILWGAGVAASPLGARLAELTGATVDRAGRIAVQPDCSLPGHPEIYCLGDMMSLTQEGKPLPGVAQVAIQQGVFAARKIARRAEGRPSDETFRYRDLGSMATIGRAAAVADLGWLHLSGYLAWLAWLFIHLIYLVAFENRVLVLFQWSWNYFTRNRSARLVTHHDHPITPRDT